MYRLRYRIVAAVLVVTAALCVLVPGLLNPAGDWPRLRLGLDLRGGVQLTLGVDTAKALRGALLAEGQMLRQSAAEKGLTVLGPRLTGGTPELLLPSAARLDALLELIRSKAPNVIPGTPRGETGGVLRIPLAFTPQFAKQTEELAVDQVLKTLSSRIDQFGVAEPDIRKQAGSRILVQLPGMHDVRRAAQLLGQTAQLSFHLVRPDAAGLAVPPPGVISLPQKNGGVISVDRLPLLSGETVADARPAFTERGEPMVSLTLNRQGAALFGAITEEHVGKPLAIVLDNTVHSAPVIQQVIKGGSASITGHFTVDEAQDLAIALRSGSLAAPVQVLEERTVGPALGEASIQGGLLAAVIGAMAVMVIMPLRYGLSGLLADGLLGVTLLLLMSGMAAIGATLTLPGIAGIVLTIGMAVDANVLIFERIREEFLLGLDARRAIAAGFERANLAIIDSNLTTILVAAILYEFGTGPVRGFAVTLTIGIVASMYTAIGLCRILYELWLRTGKGVSVQGIWHGRRLVTALGAFPYLRHARTVIGAALALALAAGIVLATHGPRYGVDFAGGAEARATFVRPVSDDAIRAALAPLRLEGLSLQSSGADRLAGEVWQIRFALPEHIPAQDLGATVLGALHNALPEAGAQLASMESVGPKVGDTLRASALEAIYYSLLLITVYISGRFEGRWGTAALLAGTLYGTMFLAGWLGVGLLWRMALALLLTLGLCWKLRLGFAVGAMGSLLFDVTVTSSLLVLLGEEIDLNVVAALLTIIGYSLNDTIVIFDRIREVLRHEDPDHPRPLTEVLRQSLADTMSRTLLTGGTTLASALALYLFGGAVIHGFALTMLIGVAAGTLSSLFVAAPLLPLFGDSRAFRAALTPAVYTTPPECGVV